MTMMLMTVTTAKRDECDCDEDDGRWRRRRRRGRIDEGGDGDTDDDSVDGDDGGEDNGGEVDGDEVLGDGNDDDEDHDYVLTPATHECRDDGDDDVPSITHLNLVAHRLCWLPDLVATWIHAVQCNRHQVPASSANIQTCSPISFSCDRQPSKQVSSWRRIRCHAAKNR